MNFIEVHTKADKKEFNDFAARLYKNNPYWIRPLNKDIEIVFDETQNPLFKQTGGKNGEIKAQAIRWLLQNNIGETVGRIAAFVNPKTVLQDNEQPTGGAGFFECINDEKVAFALFDKAKKWLQERGMEAMDAPINFGERNQWWGVLIDGFDKAPNYQMGYNFEYYKDFFEKWGFQEYFQQFTYGRDMYDVSERLQKIADRVMSREGYSFSHINKATIDKHAEDFRDVYNASWGNHAGVAKLTVEDSKALLKQMKPILEEDLVWFAYFEGKAIGFYVMLPELNQLFKHLNGKFGLWQKLQFMWHKLQKNNNKVFGVIFGVSPEFQRKGVELGMVVAYQEERKKYLNKNAPYQYNYIEFNWIGDFNTNMVKLCESLEAEKVKRHATYRYLFDRTKPFERMKEIH